MYANDNQPEKLGNQPEAVRDQLNSAGESVGAGNRGSIGTFGEESGLGIDPELVPYLLAADAPDEEEELADLTATAVADEEAESTRLAELRSLVEAALGGPDPQVFQEVLGEKAPEFEDDFELEDESEEGGEAAGAVSAGAATPSSRLAAPGSADPDPVAAAAREAELRAQAQVQLLQLNQQLARRAPEDNFAPTLVRMQQVLSILGDPQTSYPVIHVAGTNGKTSTSRIAEALLREFGLHTGRFTSPHLESVTERINFEGQPATPSQFVAAWEDIAPYVEMVDMAAREQGEPQVSYFEALTLMALAAFADYPVDVAVLECGLGGRWDATNVVDAGVCVITSLSLDHERWLGSTLTEIAAEKAEIIKPKSFAVIMEQPEEAMQVLLNKCREQDAVAWIEGKDWEVVSREVGVGGQLLTVRTPAATYSDLFVSLHGEFQAHNAAAALVAVEAMMGGKPLPGDVVERALAVVSSPGRLELVRTSPPIVVDGAHNPGGITALVETLPETFQFHYTVGIFAAMSDKKVEEMLALAEPHFDDLVITTLPGGRPMPLDDLKEIAEDVFGVDRVNVAETVEDAIGRAVELADALVDPTLSRGIVAFGSLKLVAAVKQLAG